MKLEKQNTFQRIQGYPQLHKFEVMLGTQGPVKKKGRKELRKEERKEGKRKERKKRKREGGREGGREEEFIKYEPRCHKTGFLCSFQMLKFNFNRYSS